MKLSNKKNKGITLIALVITIIVLLILAGVTIMTITGEDGILNRANTAREENNKATATEEMNLKITNVEILKYAEEQRMPTLKELADNFCEDDDFQYVEETSKIASLPKVSNENPTSIYTKLKAYPYEFEINSSLQLASIDGIEIAATPDDDNNEINIKNVELDYDNKVDLSPYNSAENQYTIPSNGIIMISGRMKEAGSISAVYINNIVMLVIGGSNGPSGFYNAGSYSQFITKNSKIYIDAGKGEFYTQYFIPFK